MVSHFTRRGRLPAAFLCLFAVSQAQAAPSMVNYQSLQSVLRAAYTGSPLLQSAREQLHGTQELLPQAQAGLETERRHQRQHYQCAVGRR